MPYSKVKRQRLNAAARSLQVRGFERSSPPPPKDRRRKVPLHIEIPDNEDEGSEPSLALTPDSQHERGKPPLLPPNHASMSEVGTSPCLLQFRDLDSSISEDTEIDSSSDVSSEEEIILAKPEWERQGIVAHGGVIEEMDYEREEVAGNGDSEGSRREENEVDTGRGDLRKKDKGKGKTVDLRMIEIGQPEEGWNVVHRRMGYNKTKSSSGKQSRQLRYYYRSKQKAADKHREKYGQDIRNFFSPLATSSLACDNNNSASEQSEDEERVPFYADTEKSVFNNKSFDVQMKVLDDSIHELELWIKRKKPHGQWATRCQGVLGLLKAEMWQGKHAQIEISISLSNSVGYSKGFARSLRKWALEWEEFRTPIPIPVRGLHAKVKSFFNDEGIEIAVREYLNSAKFESTICGMVKALDSVLNKGLIAAVDEAAECEGVASAMRISELLNDDRTECSSETPLNITNENRPEPSERTSRKKISIRTARRWFAKLGWGYSRDKKGYVDGHEREDVVAYRNNIFLPKFRQILLSLEEYDDNGWIPKPFPSGMKRRILVTHDESIFYAQDDKKERWKPDGVEMLKSKSKGKGLMVSEYLTAAHGRLRCGGILGNDYQEATEIIQYGSGSSDEGYWNSEKMIHQLVQKAIPIFQKAFPHHIAVFAFDNSSGHAAKAEDALVASRMNLGPGGKQPVMHDTKFGDNIHQSMVFELQDNVSPDLIGKPKGMRRVLQERGLWREGMKKQCGVSKNVTPEDKSRILDQCKQGTSCCALRVLENEPDFSGEVSLLQTIIESKGHECIFYPKFHCETNYIEYFWAEVKRYTRDNCTYKFAELQDTIMAGLNSVSLITIRRFANRSKRWIEAYMDGLSPGQKEFADRVYKSHRREPEREK